MHNRDHMAPGYEDVYRHHYEPDPPIRFVCGVAVVVTPPNTNRSESVAFPPVAIRKYRMLDGSCREAILEVLADTDAAAGEPMTCNDIHALLQANDAVHSGDTVDKALRRMADDGILTWTDCEACRVSSSVMG